MRKRRAKYIPDPVPDRDDEDWYYENGSDDLRRRFQPYRAPYRRGKRKLTEVRAKAPDMRKVRGLERAGRLQESISLLLKVIYAPLASTLVPLRTPLLSALKPAEGQRMRWGGDNMYFDVVVIR
jgi:hypothetical protein